MTYILNLIAHWATVYFLLAIEDTRAQARIGKASALAYIYISATELKKLAERAHDDASIWALFFRQQTYDCWQERIEWTPQQSHKILGTLNRLGIRYDIINSGMTYKVGGKKRIWQDIEKIAINLMCARWTATLFHKFRAGYTPDGIDTHGRYLEVKSSNNGVIYDGKLSNR